MLLRRLLLSLLLLLPLTSSLSSQEHNHGKNDLPDWYDTNCCNNNDCHPVEDSTIAFGIDELGGPMVIHRATPNSLPMSFYKIQWRTSQDERYHVCYNPVSKTPYCVYLRAGM